MSDSPPLESDDVRNPEHAPGDQPISNSAPASEVNVTRQLSRFVAELEYEQLPADAVRRTKELFIDWLGSAVAGAHAPAFKGLSAFAQTMGTSGPSTVVANRTGTTPFFAAMLNGASSHFAEQDDVHNGSVFHPGAVVFPSVLAAAEARRSSGRDVILAVVSGYETGIRVGEFLGRSHYKIFHTTGTAGVIAAAAAVSKLIGLDEVKVNHAIGTAGTQAAGLWEFLRDAADSKQIHTAMAAADGLLSAHLAESGVTGASRILEGPQGMAAGMSRDADPERLIANLNTRWAILETSLKWHASCRHSHPAADALLAAIKNHRLKAEDIESITTHVHQGAIDVLGRVRRPTTIHQAKFSMGTVLGLIAVYGRAGIFEFENSALSDTAVQSLADGVTMVYDEEIDHAYPMRWIGKVTVRTRDGRQIVSRVDHPKGDPENPLTNDEIVDKAVGLAAYSAAATREDMRRWIGRIHNLEQLNDFSGFFLA